MSETAPEPLSPEREAEIRADVAAWIEQKVREYRAAGCEQQAQELERLADEVAQGTKAVAS
ncbi:hypothetical protein ABZ883_26345 [Streptomyces sp. NPDC046977]|uniref:hypothetical protein n=1 Tax=Streptomyces sp. NPDC046977 TaxID=3154703 RepID=UPI0033C79C42